MQAARILHMAEASFESAYAPIAAELHELLPARDVLIDAHTHLGNEEGGRSLAPASLIGYLDQLSAKAQACVFPLHDPERRPAYRIPNDRVLELAGESGGQLFPFCR